MALSHESLVNKIHWDRSCVDKDYKGGDYLESFRVFSASTLKDESFELYKCHSEVKLY